MNKQEGPFGLHEEGADESRQQHIRGHWSSVVLCSPECSLQDARVDTWMNRSVMSRSSCSHFLNVASLYLQTTVRLQHVQQRWNHVT